MPISLCNAVLFTPRAIVDPATVIVSDAGKISYAGPGDSAPYESGPHLDLSGKIVAPGFINIHTHGGSGVNFYADATALTSIPENLSRYAHWAAKNGVTSFLCSIAASNGEALLELIEAYVVAFESASLGAECLGLHLEGPFLSHEQSGAFSRAWLRQAVLDEAKSVVTAGRGWVRQMTLAPEVHGATAVASYLRSQGVVVSLGHTDADYETTRRALTRNFTHVTHTYNAQRGFHHREPGALGAILVSEQVTGELIADTVHVHPAAMKLLIRVLGNQRVVLITDANAAAGLPDGIYRIGGQIRIIKNGRSVLENGTIAGSTATMDTCVRNVHQVAAVSLLDAVRMASLNPARAMGLGARIGSLHEGKFANLIVTDADVSIYLTMVRGKTVYSSL